MIVWNALIYTNSKASNHHDIPVEILKVTEYNIGITDTVFNNTLSHECVCSFPTVSREIRNVRIISKLVENN